MAKYIDSKYARGPARWKRAAENLGKSPNSSGARLYLLRTTHAFHITDEALNKGVDVRQPWEFMMPRYVRTPASLGSPPTYKTVVKRRYVTCSMYCTVMQAQLDFYVTGSLSAIETVFDGSHPFIDSYGYKLQPLDQATLQRDCRCQVCGTIVKAKRRKK